MSPDDFFRARLETMIDMRHPLAVLATRMPWKDIKAALAPVLGLSSFSGKTCAEGRFLVVRQAPTTYGRLASPGHHQVIDFLDLLGANRTIFPEKDDNPKCERTAPPSAAGYCNHARWVFPSKRPIHPRSEIACMLRASDWRRGTTDSLIAINYGPVELRLHKLLALLNWRRWWH